MRRTQRIAYLAGIVDGEGYVGIKRTLTARGRRSPTYQAQIVVKMTHEAVIDMLLDTFGGHRHGNRVPKGHKPTYSWRITTAAVVEPLTAMLPLLVVKRQQALTLLELRRLQLRHVEYRTKPLGTRPFQHWTGRVFPAKVYGLSDEYNALCDGLWLRCKALNRVGGGDAGAGMGDPDGRLARRDA